MVLEGSELNANILFGRVQQQGVDKLDGMGPSCVVEYINKSLTAQNSHKDCVLTIVTG